MCKKRVIHNVLLLLTGVYKLPSVEDWPEELRGLNKEDQEILRPFTIDTGTFE